LVLVKGKMIVEKVMCVYKHYTGLWIVLAMVRVNGQKRIKRFSFDSETEAMAIRKGDKL